MLVFTPEVLEAIEWFELTHRLQVAPGWACWQRIDRPHPGALNEQPARLMQAIEFVAGERNRLLNRQVKDHG